MTLVDLKTVGDVLVKMIKHKVIKKSKIDSAIKIAIKTIDRDNSNLDRKDFTKYIKDRI